MIIENVVVLNYLQLLTCGGIREFKSGNHWREDFEEIVKGASYIHEVDTHDTLTLILVLVIRLIVYYTTLHTTSNFNLYTNIAPTTASMMKVAILLPVAVREASLLPAPQSREPILLHF